MSEYDIIRSFASAFSRSPLQCNGLFECDSELIEIGGQLWALTMDEFTPEEDLFTSDDPETLGWNLAVATISDLLAAGASPAWFMQSLSLPKSIDDSFIAKLSAGISAALGEANCSLCGGDMGCADTWRFCGFAMGPVKDRPLTRVLPAEPQTLWVTGALGDANVAALTGASTPRFELRLSEAEAIRTNATACIDTSGGLFDALWLMHTLSPSLRLDVDLGRIPMAAGVVETAHAAGFPVAAALLGGAGEYELLFALPAGVDSPTDATCIGTVQPNAEAGLFVVEGDATTQMSDPPPCPREAATVRDHVNDVIAAARRLTERPQ